MTQSDEARDDNFGAFRVSRKVSHCEVVTESKFPKVASSAGRYINHKDRRYEPSRARTAGRGVWNGPPTEWRFQLKQVGGFDGGRVRNRAT